MKLRALLLLVFLVTAVPMSWTTSADATVVERVVAVVGGDAILLSELRRKAKPFLVQIHARSRSQAQRAAAESEMYRKVLERMIEARLIARAAAKHHVRVTDEEIDKAIERLARMQKMTVRRLLREVLRSGMSIPAYRKEIRAQLLEGKMLEMRVKGQVRVTEADMRAAYDAMVQAERKLLAYKARWIVLRLPPHPSVQQVRQREELARKLAARVRHGEDFGALARRFSDDGATKMSGGELGRHLPGELAEPIEKRLLKMEPGEVTEPFRFQDAVVLVQLEYREPGKVPDFEQARDMLAQRVYAKKMAKARQRWIEKLKRGIHIEVRL